MSLAQPPDAPSVPPVTLRRARTADIAHVRALIDHYSPSKILLSKATVTLYEDVQEFLIAEVDGEVAGCGALHVMWEDIAEVRTLAVYPQFRGKRVGAALLGGLLEQARELGVERVATLTFEVEFFQAFGFEPATDIPVNPQVFAELLQSTDEGIAEMIDLERVRPNTLGNTRMIYRVQ